MVHQTVDCRYNYTALILHQMEQYRDPLPGHQISMNIRSIKKQILGRIKPDLPGKAAEIIIDFLGPLLIIGNNQLPGKSPVLPQLMHEVNLLGFQRPGRLQRPLCLF